MAADYFNHILSAKKIMIFGIPGSGKSTFALKLSQILKIPLFHLDKYFFTANWKERSYEEFLHIQKELVNKAEWIIDGNAIRSFEMRFSKADVVLYFRFNRLLCLLRIFKRLFFKNHYISDRAEGCSERVTFRLVRYLWGFHNRVKLSIQELRQKYPHAQFYKIKTDVELNSLIEALRNVKEKKYNYKPYSSLFPDLFCKERERILSQIKNIISIEHIGSTAIPGLGGKGIIDIAISINKDSMTKASLALQNLGYEFRPSFSNSDRLYFITYLPDQEEGKRRYHIHLTYPEGKEWNALIGFRDYLKNHPEAVYEYSELKKKASQIANQDGKVYRDLKKSFFEKINLNEDL